MKKKHLMLLICIEKFTYNKMLGNSVYLCDRHVLDGLIVKLIVVTTMTTLKVY